MGKNSGIEWTHHTFNPWIGCTKVSPACANCYAERDFDHRYKKVQWGPNGTRVVTSEPNWRKPIQWNKEAEKADVRERVFCASLADVFEDWDGPVLNASGETMHYFPASRLHWGTEGQGTSSDELTLRDVRKRLFNVIDQTPYLDWLLLTKRPENIRRMWSPDMFGEKRRKNVWIGTSVENDHYAGKRIPELMKCRDLSPVLFLSCEPLVGSVDLSSWLGEKQQFTRNQNGVMQSNVVAIDWVITGGESGPNARPADPDWFRGLRDQCIEFNVPFHFKQWGEFDEHQVRVGKKNAGRLLDGVEWNQVPETREVVR